VYGLFLKLSGAPRPEAEARPRKAVLAFGLMQVAIGVSALVVTAFIRSLPSHALVLQGHLIGAAAATVLAAVRAAPIWMWVAFLGVSAVLFVAFNRERYVPRHRHKRKPARHAA